MAQSWPVVNNNAGQIAGWTAISGNISLPAGHTGNCGGVTGVSMSGASAATKRTKLELGKVYEVKGWIRSSHNGDGCMQVLGPIKTAHTGTAVRVKYWDSEFAEWDHNEWISEEVWGDSIREISRLEALVLFGAIVRCNIGERQ